MGLNIAIPKLGNIYLDTNIFIYFFEENPYYADHIEKLLNKISDQDATIISSTLLLSELLVSPYRTKNKHLIQVYQDLDQILTNLELISLDKNISQQAALLRAKYKIRTPDAIHLATAITKQANIFITADQKLKKIKEIPVKILKPILIS